jgi:hypothetical protein
MRLTRRRLVQEQSDVGSLALCLAHFSIDKVSRLNPWPRTPAHDLSSYDDAFFDPQIDGQRTRLPNLQGNFAGEIPPVQRKVPDRALALEWTCVVGDGAVHGEAAEGANQEGHERLARRRILGGGRSNRKAERGEMMVLRRNNFTGGNGEA